MATEELELKFHLLLINFNFNSHVTLHGGGEHSSRALKKKCFPSYFMNDDPSYTMISATL